MPEPAAPHAGRKEIMFWIINSGPYHLQNLVRGGVRLLYKTLLPLLWEPFRHMSAASLSPLWQAARKAAVKLIHSRFMQFCYRLVATWLGRSSSAVMPAKEAPRLFFPLHTDSITHQYVHDDDKTAEGEQQKPTDSARPDM